MGNPRCRQCAAPGGARARDYLCAPCFALTQPATCDGAMIKRLRETLQININDASAAVGVIGKVYVDEIETNIQLEAARAIACIAALEALYHERLERRERAAAPQPNRAPPGALSAEAVGG